MPVRQWVLSLPIPLRVLLAAQPELVTPVLQVVQRVVERQLLDHTGVGADPNLSHRADRILSQGWKPTLSWSAVDKCRS